MARTRRALAVPSSRRWRLSTASRTFRVLHRLTAILSRRRIRDPSARRHEVRLLRSELRSRGGRGHGPAGLDGAVGGDALDARVACVGDVDVAAGRVDGDALGAEKLARA